LSLMSKDRLVPIGDWEFWDSEVSGIRKFLGMRVSRIHASDDSALRSDSIISELEGVRLKSLLKRVASILRV
jgi:hypothetical protein